MEFFYKIMNRSKSMSPITQNQTPSQQPSKMNSHSNPGTPTQGFIIKSRPNSPTDACAPLVSFVPQNSRSPWFCVHHVGDDLWINDANNGSGHHDILNYSFFGAVIIIVIWTLGTRPSSADCKSFSTTSSSFSSYLRCDTKFYQHSRECILHYLIGILLWYTIHERESDVACCRLGVEVCK